MRLASKLSVTALSAFFLVAAGDAEAAKEPARSTVVEVATTPVELNVDAAGLRTAAQAELNKDLVLMKGKRRLVISLALKRTSVAPAPVGVSVNATVRDAKTGAMIAIIETGARAQGDSPEIRKEMSYAAVRDAIHRVPSALSTK